MFFYGLVILYEALSARPEPAFDKSSCLVGLVMNKRTRMTQELSRNLGQPCAAKNRVPPGRGGDHPGGSVYPAPVAGPELFTCCVPQ